MSDPQVISFRPSADQYAWTFGGAAPVARIRPPAVLELFTEDCFAGRVRSETDLVSEVCEFPYLNPQTGPFHIEGAEPGDTLAVHFVSIEPARDWAASTTVPLFGALTATHPTATAAATPLPEVVWIWQFDRAAGPVPVRGPPRRLHRGPADGPDARDGRRRPGQPRGPRGAGPGRVRRQHGHPGDARRGHLLPGRERRGSAVLARRRARPPGRGRDVRGRGRVRHEHGGGGRPDQGHARALAAAGVGHPPHVHRLGAAAGGRVPDRRSSTWSSGWPPTTG